MKKGYDVFGNEYGVMLKNDLHAGNSIDHKFLREMIFWIMNPGNDYSTSMANDYYLKMMDNASREKGWFMGESLL